LQQAEAVARRIATDYQPVAILASPLQRARQTAEAIARPLNLGVQPEGGLLDIDYGEFTGLSPAEAEAKFQEFYRAWLNVPHIVRFPQGESLDDVRNRVTGIIRRVTELYPDEQVLVVTHQVVCQVLICTLLGIHNGHFSDFRVDTTSLTIFELDQGRATLIRANDTCHLKDLLG
jgi:broad specificity phosphatase PhoE